MVCPPKFEVRRLDQAIAALLLAGAISIASPASAQIADDGARPPVVASPVQQIPIPQAAILATPASPPHEAPAATVHSWVVIIQFTDQNDAYLRGRPQAPPPAPRGSSIKDTIKEISQRFGIEYMGARYDSVTQIYMLRYMRNGEVVDFYVDARTNKVVGREGF